MGLVLTPSRLRMVGTTHSSFVIGLSGKASPGDRKSVV